MTVRGALSIVALSVARQQCGDSRGTGRSCSAPDLHVNGPSCQVASQVPCPADSDEPRTAVCLLPYRSLFASFVSREPAVRTNYVMLRGLALGVSAGVGFAIASEGYRVVRGSARACPKCTAPVGVDGVFRGEREPRSVTFQWSVHPLEWMARERVLRRRKCCQCQKALDATSVIVNDRTWHRKCLRCTRCDKPLKGHRYRMINNAIFDEQCYHDEKDDPLVQRSHTKSISWVSPDPSTMHHGNDDRTQNEENVKKEQVREVIVAITALKKAKRLAEERRNKKKSDAEPPSATSSE